MIRATAEELEVHERALDSVAKASKGKCLFRDPEPADPGVTGVTGRRLRAVIP